MNKKWVALVVVVTVSATAAGTEGANRNTRRPALDRIEWYSHATRPVSGQVAPKLAMLTRASGALRPVFVLVRAHDLQACEDLARQVRELGRSVGSRAELVIVTPPADSTAIGIYSQVERLSPAAIVALDPDSVFANGQTVSTPAAMIVDAHGVAIGVSHTARIPNLRLRSFAQELHSLVGDDFGTH